MYPFNYLRLTIPRKEVLIIVLSSNFCPDKTHKNVFRFELMTIRKMERARYNCATQVSLYFFVYSDKNKLNEIFNYLSSLFQIKSSKGVLKTISS